MLVFACVEAISYHLRTEWQRLKLQFLLQLLLLLKFLGQRLLLVEKPSVHRPRFRILKLALRNQSFLLELLSLPNIIKFVFELLFGSGQLVE